MSTPTDWPPDHSAFDSNEPQVGVMSVMEAARHWAFMSILEGFGCPWAPTLRPILREIADGLEAALADDDPAPSTLEWLNFLSRTFQDPAWGALSPLSGIEIR